MTDMNDRELNEYLRDGDSGAFAPVLERVIQQQVPSIVQILEESSTSWLENFWQTASRLKKLFFSFMMVTVLGFFGTATTSVARNLLSDSWVQTINDADCDVSASNARLVRFGQDEIGTKIEYWTVGSESTVVDVVVQKSSIDGLSGGTLACEPRARQVGQPFVSLSGYAASGVAPQIAIFGWIPSDTTGVVELSDGSRVQVTPNRDGDVLALVQSSSLSIRPLRLLIKGLGTGAERVIDLQPQEK